MSLTPPLYIDVPTALNQGFIYKSLTNQESAWSCLFVLGVSVLTQFQRLLN